MELLNVIMARAVRLFDIRELNPRGKAIFPELFEWLKDTYHFDKVPSSLTDLDESKGFSFLRGTFQIREEIFVDASFKIYNDGVIAETQSSTRDSQAFLETILKTVIAEFNLSFRSETIRQRIFTSEMNVRSEKQLIGINPQLSHFASKISALIDGTRKPNFEFSALAFWPEQSLTPSIYPAFDFARKINSLPEENKYWSKAPLHTDDHLNMLNEFETLFMV